MKKLAIYLMAAMLAINLTVSAQDNNENRMNDNRHGHPRGMQMSAQQRAEKLSKQLNLTAEQTQKLQALYEKQDAKRTQQLEEFGKHRKEMQQKQTKKRDELRAQREKEMKEQDAELEAIIGKEKMDQLNAFREQRKQRMEQRMNKRPQGMRKGGNQ